MSDYPNSGNTDHYDCKHDDCTHPKVVCKSVEFKKCVTVDKTLKANRVSTNYLIVNNKAYIKDLCVSGTVDINGDINLDGDLCIEPGKRLLVDNIEEKTPDNGVNFTGDIKTDGNVCTEGSVQTGSIVEKVPDGGIVIDGTVTLNDGLNLDGDVCIDAPNKLLVDTIEGKTDSDTGTVYGVPITNGLIPVGSLDSDPLIFKGCWDADTNTPTLMSGVGTNGDYYIVCVAGNTVLDGQSDWEVGDGLVFEGNTLNEWVKIENMESVVSVNGQTGVVVLNLGDLNDVVLGALAVGQTIVWDGANWVNQSLALTTLASAGGDETLVNDGVGPTLAVKGLSSGTGISLSSNANEVTINNTGVLSIDDAVPAVGTNISLFQTKTPPTPDAKVLFPQSGTIDNSSTSALTDFVSSIRVNNENPMWNAKELQGEPIDATAPAAGDYLNYDGAQWIHTPLPNPTRVDFSFKYDLYSGPNGSMLNSDTGTGGVFISQANMLNVTGHAFKWNISGIDMVTLTIDNCEWVDNSLMAVRMLFKDNIVPVGYRPASNYFRVSTSGRTLLGTAQQLRATVRTDGSIFITVWPSGRLSLTIPTLGNSAEISGWSISYPV